MKKAIKTIDVIAKEWFDRVNGNSYFSATVTINAFNKKRAKTFFIPFQYGYGEQYLEETKSLLIEEGYLNAFSGRLTRFCKEKGIELRYVKSENCKKKEVEQHAKI